MDYHEQSQKAVERFDSRATNEEFFFDVREGDGNQGEYHRCTILAKDAPSALVAAHRHGLIRSPWDVRITKDIEGDDINAQVASYVAPIWDYACRWTASASLSIEHTLCMKG